MSSITAQQTKLDLKLVPKENRLDMRKCNGRIPHGLTPREPTFQVILDAIALTLCYPAFLITADVPEVYMHQFWNSVYKHDTFYKFKLDKKKRFKLTLEVLSDIFQIFARVLGRDFDALPSEEDTVSFLRELGHTWEINSLNDVVVDQMHQPWRNFASLINWGLFGKTSGLDKLRLSELKSFGMKKSSTKPATGIVIREPHVERKSKRKEKEKKSLRDFHKTHPSGSGTVAEILLRVDKITPTVISEGTGDKPGVPDVIEDDSTESESESWGNDEDDNNNEQESSNEGNEQNNESEKQESDSEQEEESEDDDQEDEEFTDKEIVQGEGADAEMNDAQQGNENLETTQEQVVKDAHVTISTVTKKTEVPITSSSHVHVHHEFLRTQAPTLLTIPVSVITESSPIYTNIPQSSQTFTPPPILTTPNPPPTIETTNPLSTLPDFASVFRFNDRITTLEKEVAELKKDPLHTQVTTLVDEHLDTRLGETREEFMNFLSESLTARIKEQVKDQLPQILPKEVSNFAPPVIEKLIKESRDEVTLAKVSSQPHSTYEAASTLTEFELKKILIDKMEKSESYLAAPEHRDCYDSLKKSYDLDKDFFFSYDVYSLKRSRKDKDKDEDPSAGSDRGLKKRKLSKDAEPTTEEPVSEVANKDIPQDHEGDMDKTPQKGLTQKWLTTLVAFTSTNKSLKDFDELIRTLIDFFGYILNGLKIKNLTQEILLGPAFRLLKGTRSNYAELEYDFKECYKALSEKLDWENPEGGDYPFDLSKPLPLITRRKRQRVL
ncbi:hypothetical protein Tco_1338260 [Tanacetum coccineum]